MLKQIAVLMVLGTVAVGCDQASDGAAETKATTQPASPQVSEIAHHYKLLKAMTPEPVDVDPELAMLCRGVSQADVEQASQTKGPHAYTQVMIYMNKAAAGAFGKSQACPVGSVIVKEKTGQPYRTENSRSFDTQTPSGVGGMIKRPAGYDADHGDWEYFYFESPDKIESGKIATCVGCHAGAAKTDHVFGSWARAK